jgi:hypothetical protein
LGAVSLVIHGVEMVYPWKSFGLLQVIVEVFMQKFHAKELHRWLS